MRSSTKYRSRSSRRERTAARKFQVRYSHDGLWIVCINILFVCALIFGGVPTRLMAIPVLAVALWKLSGQRVGGQKTLALWLLGFLVLLPVLQLVPLPPSVWTQLPGREIVVREFADLGLALPWMPLSLFPDETVAGALIPLPAIALFCAALTLDLRGRATMISTFLAVCLISALVGILQSSGPLQEVLRFRSETSPAGFLRNRNHFAALLYSAIPFVAIKIEEAIRLPMEQRIRKLFLYAPFLGCLMLAIGVSTSRSGMTLALVALLASAILMIPARSRDHSSRMAIWILVIGGLSGIALTLHFDFLRLFTRLSLNPLDDARVTMFRVGLLALQASFPAGVGFGAFAQFYPLHQSTYDAIPFYVNYLHNDIVQFLIEGGVLALLAMLAFVGWYFHALIRLGDPQQDRPSAMAAAIAILFLLVHAVLEYHLRSIPVLSAFALFCALLTPGAAPAAAMAGSGPGRADERQATPGLQGPVAGPA